MPATDALLLTFVTTGADQAVGAFSRLGVAQEKYANNMAKFKASTDPKDLEKHYNAARDAARTMFEEQIRQVGRLAAAFSVLVVVMAKMMESYTDFGTKVMNLSQLTGSSLQSSA